MRRTVIIEHDWVYEPHSSIMSVLEVPADWSTEYIRELFKAFQKEKRGEVTEPRPIRYVVSDKYEDLQEFSVHVMRTYPVVEGVEFECIHF